MVKMPQPPDSRALSIVCLEPCLWIGDHLEMCKPPTLVEAREGVTLYTWIPEEAEWVYLIKLLGFTLAYLPERDTVHFVNPAYAIGHQCPPNTAFLCQFVKDSGCAPRLLALDLLYEKGASLAGTEPAARYARLQALSAHFPGEHCVVQWCGHHEALTPDFMRSLPHKCRGLLGLGSVPGVVFMESLSQ